MSTKKLASLLYFFAPNYLRRKAMKRLSNPVARKTRPFEDRILAEARKHTRPFKHFTIADYTWGYGPKKALLIHGWEGRAANFAALIPLLVDHGYTVRAFDAPSHGNSSIAPSSMLDYSDLTAEFLKEGPYELLLSHSFGSVPLTFALNRADAGMPIHRMMFITSPDRFTDRVDQIIASLGLPDRAKEPLLADFEKATGLPAKTLSVSQLCSKLEPLHARILHGSSDQVLPIAWSKRVSEHLANCRFIQIEDAGHYRILWHQDTQRELLELIKSQ